MEGRCELLENCGFFKNFRSNKEVKSSGFIETYCDSREKSERCVRKKIRNLTGSPPPDSMAPTGEMLRTFQLEQKAG